MRLIGRLVGESDGGPLGGLNVRGYAYGRDDELLSLGYGTADEDGSFSLEAGWSATSPTGDSVRLRLEVLDGRLGLVHALEQEMAVDSPDSLVNVTVVVPFAGQSETADPPGIRADIGSCPNRRRWRWAVGWCCSPRRRTAVAFRWVACESGGGRRMRTDRKFASPPVGSLWAACPAYTGSLRAAGPKRVQRR
jgi:hypothetical protein